jgi:hypothetical protein
MKTLNVEQRLEFAFKGVAELRTLASNKTKVRYEQFANAIGLVPSGASWEVRYSVQYWRSRISSATTERRGGAPMPGTSASTR